MPDQSLSLELGRVARLILGRSDDSNRLDERSVRDLASACEAVASAQDVRVLLVYGEGDDFCAGWAEGAREAVLERGPPDPFGCLAALPLPVLAAVHGRVVGAGLELALACDIRIAAAGARFGLPDVAQGSLPIAGGTQRLMRVAGRAFAARMLLLAEEIDAQQAYSAGLVSRVVPAAELLVQAEAIAGRIASLGPLGLRYAKEAVYHGQELPLDEALRYELDLSIILQTTGDRAEGVRAFLEKRPPRFNGR